MPKETARAKINLNLHVLGRLPGGYHDLQSLVVFADFGDELVVNKRVGKSHARCLPQDHLVLCGPFAALLEEQGDNLVLDAVRAFRHNWPQAAIPPLDISLEKNLPVAAGIGGGSADAAAMLRVLARMSEVEISFSDLHHLGASLGADVPVCLQSAPAIMVGKGEKLDPVENLPEFFLVVVNPLQPVSTAKIFRALETPQGSALPPLPCSGKGFSSLAELIGWLGKTRNDLLRPATEMVPAIGQIVNGFDQYPECLFAGMSGSGASVFAMFETLEQAQDAARSVQQRWPACWCRAAKVWQKAS